ncbi:MAG: magnesium/cobalt efflux protein [Gammaproteobacteria bacterium CG11_big_fil_rev_8_21_14_0_20_46_22]|nr:MAG: magnesium/cobalt efflux protein [Gammaproteobacteria bacterium CG12_big_fil_rev_8_21_14_0_65_46_12]PIR10823.1 MAG: magnesium/cobalt efflux protein [Gammaproteobacteria bacterium CG11_big_fil_rev_8_21_14_0_20_46_22]
MGLVMTLLVAIVLLVIISGFFSSSETCMMALNRYRLRHLAKQGNRAAKRVEKLLERPDRLLGVILIGNTFANILASSLATFLAVYVFGNAGIVVATILLTLVVLIFAEIAPKTVAAMYPSRLAFFYSLPLTWVMWLIYPIVWLANTIVNGFLGLFRIRVKGHSEGAESLDPDELRTVVDESPDAMYGKSKDMLLGILDLNKIKVEDVMLPRSHIIGIDVNQSKAAIIETLIRAEHTRFPLYRDNLDNVLGILNLRDALRLLGRNRFTKKTLVRALHPSYFIPEGTPLITQLSKFKGRRRRSALVVDEYGDIQGMVTLEDILEEIVGELDSDVAAIKQSITPIEGDAYIVDGNVYLRELNKFMQWTLPIREAKTLSGLVVEKLQAIPKQGDKVTVAGYELEVISVQHRKVARVRVVKTA